MLSRRELENYYAEFGIREGYNREPGQYSESGPYREIPKYSVFQTPDMSVEIEFEDCDAVTLSTLPRERNFNPAFLVNFTHNFTFAIFGTDLDQKLSEHFSFLGDDQDGTTPDLIFQMENTKIVCEFTTCFSCGRNKRKDDFDLKVFKYEDALRRRQFKDQFGVEFFVIVATREGVYHNMPFMPQDTVDELTFRYRVALAIRETLVEKNILPPLEREERSKEMKETEIVLSSIPEDYGDPEIFHPFTPDDYQAWLGENYDEEYVQRQISKAVNMAKDDIRKLQEPVDVTSMIENYKAECRKGSRRDDRDVKSVCIFPMWCPKGAKNKTSDITSDDFPYLDSNSSNPEIRVWSKVKDEVAQGNVSRLDDEISAEEAFSKETSFKNQKLHYHRVNIEVDPETSLELAKVGVHAKKFKDDPDVFSYRSQKKKPMTLDVDTSSITDFLTNGHEIMGAIDSIGPNDGTLRALNLLEHSSLLHESRSTKELIGFTRVLMGSNLGLFSSFISDIATELDISLRQHVKSKEAIIKKLRYSNVLLLIVPTNSSGHLFFSLMCKKEALTNDCFPECFMDTKEEENCYFTQFVSVNSSKLENLSKFESTMVTMVGYWHSFFEVPFWQQKSFLEGKGTLIKRIWFNTLFCLLVSLSDKEQVEEHITMSRYMCMEGFKEVPMRPTPEKMLEKFTTTPRSTLCVWVIQKLLEAIPRIKPRYRVNVRNGELSWEELFNPWDGQPLRSPNQLISCFYIGYLKNKNENSQNNSLTKLYTKVIKMEERMPKTDKNLSQGDPEIEDIKVHEFSMSFMKFLVAHGKKYLKRNLGQSWKEIVDAKILDMMSSYTIEEFSTLKASSNYGPSWFSPNNHEEAYRRRKVVEAVRPLLVGTKYEKITHVIHLLNIALVCFNEDGTFNIDIFPKGQHGGQREITVLEIMARICQLMVELISRALCSFFECETMMHPKNKSKIPEQHFKTAKKDCGSDYITSSTSDDATTWCQGHFVSKFGLMMVQLTGKKYHNLILRTLRMWMNKRMMIAEPIIKTIQKHGLEIKTTDPCFQKMVEGFVGTKEISWMDQGKTYIKVRTGMMQGILHYTSSLLHALFITFMVSFAKREIDETLSSAGIRGRCVVSGLESSDDSEMTVSSPVREKEHLPVVLGAHAIMFLVKAHLSRLIGVETSLKSTTGTVGVMEFNSEFHFGHYQYKPTIRWVIAACMISERESLASRQEEMANLLTNVLEGGGSMFLAGLCQVAQGLLHYRLMGSSVSPFFDDYSNLLKASCDPAFGYFLMDHPMAAGMAGFQYNLWNCVTKTPLGIKYHHFIRIQENDANDPFRDSQKTKRVLETTGTGTFVQGTLIRWGNRDKWRKIIESLDLPEDWLELTDENPEVIYKMPKTTEDVLLRLAIKMSSPGVSESLSKGNALSRIIASSVYILSHHVITESNYWLLDPNENPGKRTLLGLMKEMKEQTAELMQTLDDRELTTLFPFRMDYESLRANLEQFSDLSGIEEADKYRKVTTKVEISETDGISVVSPVKLVTWKWFGNVSIPASRSVLNKLWKNLKVSIPFLADTAAETLENSPFIHHIQLFNYLKKQDKKKRVVNLSGVPIKSKAGLSNVVTAIFQDFYPGYRLTRKFDIAKRHEGQQMSTLMHCIHMILTSPQSNEIKEQLVIQMIQNSEELAYNKSVANSRRNFVATIQKFLLSEDEEVIKEFIYDNKLGIIGGYTQKQTYNEGKGIYEGQGIWAGTFGDISVRIFVNSKGEKNYIERVFVSSAKNIRELLLLLKHWCKSMEVKNDEVPQHFSTSEQQSRVATILNFDTLMTSNAKGVPIILEKNLKYVFDPSEIGKLSFSIKGMTLRLNATYGKEEIKRYYDRRTGTNKSWTKKPAVLTLLSFTSKDKDVMNNIESMFTDVILKGIKEPYKSWVLHRSVDTMHANRLIGNMMENFTEGYERKAGWLRSCFKGSLDRYGFSNPGQLAALDLPSDFDVDDSSLDDMLIKMGVFEMSFNDRPEVTKSWADELLEGTPQEAEELTRMDEETKDRMLTIASEVTGPGDEEVLLRNRMISSHPFLDKLLSQWIKDYYSGPLRELIISHVYSRATEHLVPRVSFLLGVDESKFHAREYIEDSNSDDELDENF